MHSAAIPATISYSAVEPGQTVEHQGKRYAVDNAGTYGINTTAGVRIPATPTVTILSERGIPALGTEPEARPAGTVVRFWSGMRLRRPGTLTRRADLLPGDVVQSSHGYQLSVTETRRNFLAGHLHHAGSGHIRTECYDDDSLIPVVHFAPRPRKFARDSRDLDYSPGTIALMGEIRSAFDALTLHSPQAAQAMHEELAKTLARKASPRPAPGFTRSRSSS